MRPGHFGQRSPVCLDHDLAGCLIAGPGWACHLVGGSCEVSPNRARASGLAKFGRACEVRPGMACGIIAIFRRIARAGLGPCEVRPGLRSSAGSRGSSSIVAAIFPRFAGRGAAFPGVVVFLGWSFSWGYPAARGGLTLCIVGSFAESRAVLGLAGLGLGLRPGLG